MLCADDTENKKQPEFSVEPEVGTSKMWVHFTPPKKKNPLRSVSEWVAGGDSRSRTDDFLLAKQAL